MTFKPVMRWDRDGRMLRLFRLLWTRGVVGDGNGYSAKLSFALAPRLLSWSREMDEWFFCIAGIRIHYQRAYGGIIV